MKAKLLYIVFLLMPSLIFAQVDKFQQEFMEVNQRYLSEKNIMVTQQYFFLLDSAAAVPFDSSYCYIEKYGGMTHYSFNGVESFNDGTYLIRISNPDKYMIVSKIIYKDTSALGFFFKKGLSSFKKIVKKNITNELSLWNLTGGIYGVLSVDITFDMKKLRIKKIFAELSPENPIVNLIKPRKSAIPHTLFVKIDYDYSTELMRTPPQLSDYIHVENNVLTPAEKFKNYQIKFIK